MEPSNAYTGYSGNIFRTIRNISSIQNIQDNMTWEFTQDGQLSIKAATWQIITIFRHILKLQVLSGIWKLELLHRMKIFAWRPIKGIITRRSMPKHQNISVDESCPFCNKEKQDISNLIKDCQLCRDIWQKDFPNYPTPLYTNWILSNG